MNYYKMLKEAKKNKLDPVDKDELEGSHDEREDGDIDNDGDEDSSDKYLHGRRKAISKAIAKKKMAKEEAELDEAMTAKQRALAKADEQAQKKKDVSLKKAPWDKKNEEVEVELDEAELEEKAYVSSLSPKFGEKGSHDVIGKDGKVVKSYSYTKQGMSLAQKHLAKMKEEVEELDEISNKLKDRYIQKSMDDHAHSNAVRKDAESTGNNDLAAKMKARMKKRNQGQSRAFGEEVEELDEISKEALGNYRRSAKINRRQNDEIIGSQMASNDQVKRAKADNVKRTKGIERASDKMAKEEAEWLDEISKDLANRYREKSMKSSKELGDYIDKTKSRGGPKNDKLLNRIRGQKMAFKKTNGYSKVAATEEAEPEFDLVAELAKLITKDAKY